MSYPRVLNRAIDNGKTRLVSLRLTVKNAELLGILAEQSGTTMAKEANRMFTRYWDLMRIEDEFRINKTMTDWMKREIAKMKRRNVDIEATDTVVAEVNKAAALDLSRHDLHAAKAELWEVSDKMKREAEFAQQAAELETQRRALPGATKTVFDDDEKGAV